MESFFFLSLHFSSFAAANQVQTSCENIVPRKMLKIRLHRGTTLTNCRLLVPVIKWKISQLENLKKMDLISSEQHKFHFTVITLETLRIMMFIFCRIMDTKTCFHLGTTWHNTLTWQSTFMEFLYFDEYVIHDWSPLLDQTIANHK